MDIVTQLGSQDFLDKLSLFGIPAVVFVVALVALAKQAGMDSKWIPAATIIAGFITALLLGLIDVYPQTSVVIKYIVAAVLLGLAGSGAYSLTKKVRGFETVPPGSVVEYPDGTTKVTPKN